MVNRTSAAQTRAAFALSEDLQDIHLPLYHKAKGGRLILSPLLFVSLLRTNCYPVLFNSHNAFEVFPRCCCFISIHRTSWDMERSRRNGGVIKRIRICAGDIFCIAIDICQAEAFLEGPAADAGHALRDGDGCQACATTESFLTNAGHALRDGNGCQAAATIEGTYSDAGHTLGDNCVPTTGN